MQKIYLSGAIEYALNAYDWRIKMHKELSSLFKVIIPKCADIPYSKTEDKYKQFTYKKFILPDIKEVLKAEHFFVKIDNGEPTLIYIPLL